MEFNKTKIYKNYSNEYYTPLSIIKLLENKYQMKFDFDPATTHDKAKEFGISNYLTKEDDAVKQQWSGNYVWINPPFSLKEEFLIKAREYLTINPLAMIFILLPNSFASQLFQKHILGRAKIHLFNKRIVFETEGETKYNRPPFDSCVCLLTINECWEYDLLDNKGGEYE